jgi:hypothetical protein
LDDLPWVAPSIKGLAINPRWPREPASLRFDWAVPIMGAEERGNENQKAPNELYKLVWGLWFFLKIGACWRDDG